VVFRAAPKHKPKAKGESSPKRKATLTQLEHDPDRD